MGEDRFFEDLAKDDKAVTRSEANELHKKYATMFPKIKKLRFDFMKAFENAFINGLNYVVRGLLNRFDNDHFGPIRWAVVFRKMLDQFCRHQGIYSLDSCRWGTKPALFWG